MMTFKALLIGSTAALALGGTALAQDHTAAPAYGAQSLNSGFDNDPATIAVQAGGAIDAANLDDACYGYITHQPSYNLDYAAGAYDLFISAASDADGILVVRDPNGTFHCNDDAPGLGLNPGVEIDGPVSGEYNIWVGSLGYGEGFEPAMLYISELSFFDENPFSLSPDANLPAGERLSLRGGFSNDPRIIPVQAGGGVDVSRATQGMCWGNISEAPDVVLDYSARRDYELFLSMQSDTDTTLAVQTPSGEWVCDDDEAGDLNPGVHITEPESGRYAIWAGRFSSGPQSDADLYISEQGFLGEVYTAPELDYALPSNYGAVELQSGFTPDPYNVEVRAGGDQDVFEAVGQNCYGWATSAPDYDLTYEAGSFDLYISATSDSDATLIVNAPDGSWWCDDDSAGSLNPGIQFDDPQSGMYNIWVGSYGEYDEAPATLHISELSFGDEYLSNAELDWMLAPVYGRTELEGGFTPDPYLVSVEAGGPISASEGADFSCAGYVTAAPSYELSFTAGDLPLYITANSDADTTLVVNSPSGEWYCNDDNMGTDPGLGFDQPESGLYHIWVGTYWSDSEASAELAISELGYHHE